MTGDSNTNKNLWIVTGFASVPFAILAIIDVTNITVPHIYFLLALASIFNGILVPFVLFKGEPGRWKKNVALAVNMVFCVFWIEYTGGIKSIFYPVFFLLPILTATVYGEFLDAILTAVFASGLSFLFLFREVGLTKEIISDSSLLVNIVFFFLVSSIIGYIIKVLREQQVNLKNITSELETAYNKMAASNFQLDSYTEVIEKMNEEMEQLAVMDELTMLYNYRYFQVILDKELKKNKAGTVSLMMLDIDHFRNFNEAYGHIMGNKLLTEIARIIKDNIRDSDTAVRYGGEEFAVIFPGMQAQEVVQTAEKIKRIVENTAVEVSSGKHVNVTISAGISNYLIDARNKSELISHADLALFDAKEAGRNQIRIYEMKHM
jgi:diguanylate cyclase (GGDEF)-like protein